MRSLSEASGARFHVNTHGNTRMETQTDFPNMRQTG